MPYLKVVNGRIVEADPHSSEGQGMKTPRMGEAWGETTYSGDHNKASDALEYYAFQEKRVRALEEANRAKKVAQNRRAFLAGKEQEASENERRRTQVYQEMMARRGLKQGSFVKEDFETPLSGNGLEGGFGCSDGCMTEDEHRLKAYMRGDLSQIPQAYSQDEYRQKNLQKKLENAKAAEGLRQARNRYRK